MIGVVTAEVDEGDVGRDRVKDHDAGVGDDGLGTAAGIVVPAGVVVFDEGGLAGEGEEGERGGDDEGALHDWIVVRWSRFAKDAGGCSRGLRNLTELGLSRSIYVLLSIQTAR